VQNKLRYDAIEPIALVPMIDSTKVTAASSAWVDVNWRAQQNLDKRPGRRRPTFHRSRVALAPSVPAIIRPMAVGGAGAGGDMASTRSASFVRATLKFLLLTLASIPQPARATTRSNDSDLRVIVER
jgi:hypothetical protein